MPEDLFNRFRAPAPAPTAKPPGEDPSGLAYRASATASRISEAEVMGAIERIPSMPLVVQKLLMRTGNLAASTADLEDLIKQDMALAGRLLKLVNSPFYGLGQTVASITQAVAIIGLASLKSLAVAASTSNLLAVDLGGYGFVDKGLWLNSCATAAVAKSIAQANGANRDEAEEYFVGGLLRDIGMLVLGPFLVQRHLSLRRSENPNEGDLLRRERALLGFDHCWAGERVAEKWSLPDSLRLIIGHHHRIPGDASAKVLRQLASVRLAERLTYTAAVGVAKNHPFDTQIDAVLIQASGLTIPAFQKLMAELPTIIKDSDLSES